MNVDDRVIVRCVPLGWESYPTALTGRIVRAGAVAGTWHVALDQYLGRIGRTIPFSDGDVVREFDFPERDLRPERERLSWLKDGAALMTTDDRAARIAAALPFSVAQVKRILDLCEGDEELARERLTIAAETGLGVLTTRLFPRGAPPSEPAIANPRVGARVRLRDTPLGIALRADTGTITRPDERYDEHWIVRLDQAAYSIEESDLGTEIPEIVMHQDNLLAP